MREYCPYCGKEVNYKVEKRMVEEFRGIEINTFENVAICNICGNDLYIGEIEEENNRRVYDLYREKVDIIKPEDIIKLRGKYSISQRELTAILGFGKMTINRYERGGVPTKSQSDYLKLLINNENEFIRKAKEAYENGNITEKTYQKIVPKNNKEENMDYIDIMLKSYIMNGLLRKPDIYNGYKELDIELLENIISYIASKVKNLTITSINKYLWFIDSLSFKKRGISITGLTYQKQQYGPTIADYKYNEISRLNNKYNRIEFEDQNGKLKVEIKSKNNFDLSKLKQSEREIIDKIIGLLKDKKVGEISEMSHKEDGWINTENLKNISFEYSINLNIIK